MENSNNLNQQPSNNQPIISEQNQPNNEFKVNVKLLSNQVYEFIINPNLLISEFKKIIQDKINVPIERQRLVFGGKQLLDQQPIKQYGKMMNDVLVKESGMTVHLIAKSVQAENGQGGQNSQGGQNNQGGNIQQPNINAGNIPPPNTGVNPMGGFFNMMNGMMGNMGSINITAVNGGNPIDMNQINNTVNSMLGGLGIRIPPINLPNRPPTNVSNNPNNQPNPTQNLSQPQSAQTQSQNLGQNVSQNSQPNLNQPTNQNTTTQPNQPYRITNNPILQLNHSINSLLLPPQPVNEQDELNLREQASQYLRRLQHQMLRFIPQLNRGIQLLNEGRTTHLQGFIPIFQALNNSNEVAMEAIQRLLNTSPNDNLHSQPAAHLLNQANFTQSNMIAEEPVNNNNAVNITTTIIIQGDADDSEPMEAEHQIEIQLNPQVNSNNQSFPMQHGSSGQVPLPTSNIQGSQPVANPFAEIDMMGMLGQLNQNGGMGALMGMSLGQMLEEDNQQSSIYSQLFRPINGSQVLGCFLQKNFSFLNQKRPNFRNGTLKAIAIAGSREDLVQKLTQDLTNLIVPMDNIKNREICFKKVRHGIRKYVEELVSLFLSTENIDFFSDKIVIIFKRLICESIEETSKFCASEEMVFANLKKKTLGELDKYVPGLSGMFYMVIEKDLNRIYKEHLEEQKRKQEMTEQEAHNQVELLAQIEKEANQDIHYLCEFEHSQFYFPKKT